MVQWVFGVGALIRRFTSCMTNERHHSGCLVLFASLLRKGHVALFGKGENELRPGANVFRVDCGRIRVPAPNSGASRPVRAQRFCTWSPGRRVALDVVLLGASLLRPCFLAAAPVAVRFPEGLTHGFIVVRTLNGVLIASGDLLQVSRGREVESRMLLQFKDGSRFEETVVFTQQRVFLLNSYHLLQRGPAFKDDTEISLERASGKYQVKTKAHKDGKQDALEGTLDLPLDVYNGGMVLIVAKNLPKGTSETVHTVAFTPTPRLVHLELAPAGEQRVLVGELAKTATEYVFKPKLGVFLKLFATLLGQVPPDSHAWIVTSEVPAFVRFEVCLAI